MALEDYLFNPGQQAPEQEESLLGDIAHMAWTPVGMLLDALGKPGRAVRGALAGRFDELANLVPFSDSLHLTDPNRAVSGRDLNRMYGLADGEDTWANWFGGLGTEILTDPLNLITLGTTHSLTAAGRAAKMGINGATLADTAAGRIAAEQAGLAGIRSPWFYDAIASRIGLPTGNIPLFTGEASEKFANAAGQGLDALTRKVPYVSPVVAKLRSMFEYGTGVSQSPETVAGFSGVVPRAELEARKLAYPFGMEATDRGNALVEQLLQRGMPLKDAQKHAGDLVTAAVENAQPAYTGLGAVHPDLLELAEQAANPIRQGQKLLRDHQRALGLDIEQNLNPFELDYLHRQIASGGVSRNSAVKSRVIPEELLPGGAVQANQLASDPVFAGYAAKPFPKDLPLEQLRAAVEHRQSWAAEHISDLAIKARDAQYHAINAPIPERLADEALRSKSKDFARFLSEMDPEQVASGVGLYRNDPLGSFLEYTENAAAKAGVAKGALNTLAREAQPVTMGNSRGRFPMTEEEAIARRGIAEDPTGFMNLDEAMTKLGLTARETLPEVHGFPAAQVQPTLVESGGKKTLAEMLGLPTNGAVDQVDIRKALQDKIISNKVVNNLEKEFAPLGKTPSYGLGATAEKVTSAARAAFTTPWPAFHVRNTYEGAIQQMLGGGFSPQAWADLSAYRAGTLDPIKDAAKIAEMSKYVNEGFNANAFGRGQAFAQLGKSAVNLQTASVNPLVQQTGKSTGQAVKDYLKNFGPKAAAERGESYLSANPFRIFSKPEESAFLQAGNKVHNDVDTLVRGSQYTALRRQGYEPHAAADVVMRSQMDYSKLTPTERLLRQLIPFYSFSKQNMVRLADQLGDPGAITSLLRATASARGEDVIPNYVSPGSAVPIPGAEEGSQRYLSGLSMPFDDEVLGGVLALASGRPRDAARRMLSASDPITKLITALGTNTQIYSGRSLDEVTPSPITSLGGLLSNGTANVVGEALGASPLGRLLSTANSAVNGRDQNILLKLLTGIKTTDVDTDMARNVAARDALEAALKRTGMVGVANTIYAKDEFHDPANQPEELKQMLAMMKMLQDQARAAKAARLNQLPTP